MNWSSGCKKKNNLYGVHNIKQALDVITLGVSFMCVCVCRKKHIVYKEIPLKRTCIPLDCDDNRINFIIRFTIVSLYLFSFWEIHEDSMCVL